MAASRSARQLRVHRPFLYELRALGMAVLRRWFSRCCLATYLTALLALSTYHPLAVSAAEPPRLAISVDLTVTSLNRSDLKAIFLGRRREWSDGTRIRIFLPAGESEQRAFLEAVVERSPSQFWAHWRNIVFAGRGTMPKTLKSSDETVNFLKANSGAIGIVGSIDIEGSGVARIAPLEWMETQ